MYEPCGNLIAAAELVAATPSNERAGGPEQRCASWHGQVSILGRECKWPSDAAQRATEPCYGAIITTVIRCCMSGMEIGEHYDVFGSDSEAIRDLCAAGEVARDVHGNNRLGVFFLLEGGFRTWQERRVLSTCWATG